MEGPDLHSVQQECSKDLLVDPLYLSSPASATLYDAINSSRWQQQQQQQQQQQPNFQCAAQYQHPTFAPYPFAATSTSEFEQATADSARSFVPAALQRLPVGQVLPSIPPSIPPSQNAGAGAYLPTTHPPERPLALAPAPLKKFVAKLWHLVSQPDSYRDCVCWSHTGTSFILCHSNPRFATVLSALFKHSNLQSFTRQLNVYAFARVPASELGQHVALNPDDKSEYSA